MVCSPGSQPGRIHAVVGSVGRDLGRLRSEAGNDAEEGCVPYEIAGVEVCGTWYERAGPPDRTGTLPELRFHLDTL